VPPFVGVAVNVTDVPEQIVVLDAEIETDGFKLLTTLIVRLLDVAVELLEQFAFEVSTQVITSPETRPVAMYVDKLSPTLVPFFFH
jgi:hypothetical protein